MQETEDIVTRVQELLPSCTTLEDMPGPYDEDRHYSEREIARLNNDRELRCLVPELLTTIATLRAEVEGLRADAERYRWLANRVLACDYGDNDAPGEQIGWRIRHDLLAQHGKRQPAFMYGASINAAIDAAKAAKA